MNSTKTPPVVGPPADFFDAATARNWRGRLSVSVEVMRELSRYSDPDEMYVVFSRRMSQLFPTSRQLSLSRRGMQWPAFRVMRSNLWTERVNPWKEPHRLPSYTGGLLADLVYGDGPRVIDELRLTADDPAGELLVDQRSVLAIPLFEQGVGTTMLILGREDPGAFPREQVPELVWMSNLFARATQTLVLTQRLKDAYESADYELRAVADLQHSLLPAGVPTVPGLEVAVHYRTANRAGGDYYDFFPLPDGKLGVLVADVSGHGTPAAVLMAITHSLAHAYAHPPATPGVFLAYLNDHLAKRYTRATGTFVTAFYAVFDPAAGTVTFASAGHPPPRVGRADGWRPFPPSVGLPLGIAARETAYPEQVLPFRPGDRAAIFTDGVLEAADAAGDDFGFDRLDAALVASPAAASDVVNRVLLDLDRHAAGVPLADDRTLVAVRAVPG